MSTEAWAKGGAGVVSGLNGIVLFSIGPIPVGVYVERLEISVHAVLLTNYRMAVTVSEAPARTVGDMVGEEPIYGDHDSQITGGPSAWSGRFQSIIASVGVWAWGFEVLSGPRWINVALQITVNTTMTLIVSAFGFRRVRDERCRFEKT